MADQRDRLCCATVGSRGEHGTQDQMLHECCGGFEKRRCGGDSVGYAFELDSGGCWRNVLMLDQWVGGLRRSAMQEEACMFSRRRKGKEGKERKGKEKSGVGQVCVW